MEVHGVKTDRSTIDRIRSGTQTRYSLHGRPGYAPSDHVVFFDEEAPQETVTVEVIGVSDEHAFKELTEGHARAEGFETLEAFASYYDGLKRNREKKSQTNPCLFAVTFKLSEEQRETAPGATTAVAPSLAAKGPLARKQKAAGKSRKSSRGR